MTNFNKLAIILLCLLMPLHYNGAFAQNKTTIDAGEVSTVLTPHSSNAIFTNKASYTFSVKNDLDKSQTGKVSYEVTDQFNKKLLADSIQINLDKKSSHDYDFTIPELKSGFYKINFMVNVSDYDDTTRRVFGIRPEEIRSSHQKPADFDGFWKKAKDDLAKVKPNYKITEKPELAKDGRNVYLIEMKSLDNVTIYAWLSEPAHFKKSHKFPVLMVLPGYQAANSPILGKDDDIAFLNLDVRGQGLSKKDMMMRGEDYIISNLENKNRYIMRGIIMDCIRCVDFIFTRPEFSRDRISVTGGSMGGYLSITTAALDKRVALCAPQNPIFSDIYNMDRGAVRFPIEHMKEYVTVRPGLTFEQVLDNLQYFDAKNFATNITCPVLMGIGLLDPYVPPNNSYTVYNNINAKKKLFVFKDLGHEVGNKYYNYEERWTRDYFALF
jgi:cephalosporin-C deacetylase